MSFLNKLNSLIRTEDTSYEQLCIQTLPISLLQSHHRRIFMLSEHLPSHEIIQNVQLAGMAHRNDATAFSTFDTRLIA